MNNKLGYIIAFAAGAGLGSVATWRYLKNKYEQIAREEIESVRQMYREKEEELVERDEEVNVVMDAEPIVKNMKPAIFDYVNTIRENKYIIEEKEGGTKVGATPYVISPEEFGENGYDTETLYYYADGVLADDTDEPIEDTEFMVGENFADHFGEYEDDSVFVRNDELGIDYEILMDSRNFEDVIGR